MAKKVKLGKFEMLQATPRCITHVLPEEGPGKGWVVLSFIRNEPDNKISETFSSKTLAVSTARAWAKSTQPSQVYVHGLNGRIQTEWTYPRSSDPHPPKGRKK